MELLIFKTDINTQEEVNKIQSVFDRFSFILDWSIDLEDVDKVLRVEALDGIKEHDIVTLTNVKGYMCTPLPD